MEWTGMALFYLACLALGFLFAILGAIFGEFLGHGGVEVGGHEVEMGHGTEVFHEFQAGGHALGVEPSGAGEMPGASFLNSITISVFVAILGLMGLVVLWGLRLSPLASLAVALPTALIVALAQFVLYVKLFVKAQASSEATMDETLGCEAEVITTIPADHLGEIAYVIKGSRYTAPAASADGDEIMHGTRVRVVNIRGATLIVRPE